jgi:DNA-binding LacI/PurR family transcriptional regulator
MSSMTYWKRGSLLSIKMIDIANEADVSTATVGRVLHEKGYVSQDARKRVEAAVKKFNYIPNAAARSLTQKKSGIIGSLVIENVGNLYQRINSSVMTAAEKQGYHVVMLQGRNKYRDEELLINQFIGMRIDGLVVITNIYFTDELFDKLKALSIPVVMVERTYDYPGVDNILFLDEKGAYDAVMKFYKAGHRRIAFIGREPFAHVEQMRLDGYKRALTYNKLALEDDLIKIVPSYAAEFGKKAMQELLFSSHMPTGIFCTADTLAAGALQALYEAGKKVPDDFSISGYDNILSKQLSPPIDSVEPDLEKVGEVVVSLIGQRIENPHLETRIKYIDTVSVSRGSITAPNNK